MTPRGEAIAERARALIGTRFRPQGRGRDGLDCAGLASLALELPPEAVPRSYGRARADLDLLSVHLRQFGLTRLAAGAAAPGDLLVFAAGLGRFHLGIATGPGFVHADAALRRVAERPLPAPWPVASIWRPAEPHEREHVSWPHSS